MVITSAQPPAPAPYSETLPGTLAIAGRSAPIRLLVALCALGTAATVAILLLARHWWILTTPLALGVTFGGWGLTEQARAAVNRRDALDPAQRFVLQTGLRIAGVLMILAGAVAFTILVFAITFFLAGDAPVL